MTTTINASNSGSGGLIQTADASGVLALQTAGTTALTISAAQVVTFANALLPASGGTGGGSFTANSVLLGNGTSAFQTVAPSTSGNVLTSNGTTWSSTTPTASGFGIGQTLTNFSSSGRAMDTTYTNSTGKPIAVMFAPIASGNLFAYAVIDGNNVEFQQFTPSGGGGCAAFFIMVPNGSTYRMTNAGNASLSLWWEWR